MDCVAPAATPAPPATAGLPDVTDNDDDDNEADADREGGLGAREGWREGWREG